MKDFTNRFEVQVYSGPIHVGGHGLKDWRTVFYCENELLAQQLVDTDKFKSRRVLDTTTNQFLKPKVVQLFSAKLA